MEIPIPEKVLPDIQQCAMQIQAAQNAMNNAVNLVIKSIGAHVPEGARVNLDLQRRVFVVLEQPKVADPKAIKKK
jgi:hypothetical protein